MEKQSSDKVEAFKHFVKAHPGMIKEVRNGNKTWQHFFEEWTIFGENDDHWDKYNKDQPSNGKTKTKTDTKKSLNMEQVISMLKTVDLNQIGQYASQFSGAMTTVQELLAILKPNQTQQNHHTTQTQNRPQQRQPYDYPHPFFRD